MGATCSRYCGRDARTNPYENRNLLPTEDPKEVSPPPPPVSWVVNPKVCWRHPALRLFVAVLIMVQDFLLYGEDPINDSYVDVNMAGFGELYGLLVTWPSSGSLIMLRVSLIVVILGINSLFAYKVLHHCFLRDCCGLSMFEEYKGTWFVMSLWSVPSLYGAALAYNYIAPQVQSDAILLVSYPGFQMRMFGKGTQCWSVFLDIISIVMIIDTVLQDQTHYPNFLPSFKKFWSYSCGGWVRVLGVWLMVLGMASATTFGILLTGHEEGHIRWTENRFLGNWTEVSRAFFLSWVLFCDILCVVQDWEFPTFRSDSNLKIAGTFYTELSCTCLAHLSDIFHIRITGKWFTYGPMFFVIGADLFSMKNQITYTPETYAQYVDPATGGLWGVTNITDLQAIYSNGLLEKPELMTWSSRRDNIAGLPPASDIYLNARYLGSSLDYLGAIPGLACLFAFLVLVAGGQCAINSAMQKISSKMLLRDGSGHNSRN